MFGTALPVAADNYEPVAGGDTTLTKYLVVEKDAQIPASEFTFSIASGTAVDATASTVKVWAGLNPSAVKIGATATSTDGKIAFTAGEEATAGPLADVTDADHKYVGKTLHINFAGVSFPEPGVYRYILTEAAAASGSVVTHDAVPTRTIDVYVEDNNGTLKVKGYVVYSGTITAGPAIGGTDAGTKSLKYINTMDSRALTVSKTVSGNQGSKDQYFEIEVELSGLDEGTIVNVDMTSAEKEPLANAATKYTAADMKTANNITTLTADAEGKITHKFYLKHGQNVKLTGIPTKASYKVVETDTAEGYTKANEVSTATAFGTEDATVGITNTREGVIPTGVLMKIFPYAIILAVAAAVIAANRISEK